MRSRRVDRTSISGWDQEAFSAAMRLVRVQVLLLVLEPLPDVVHGVLDRGGAVDVDLGDRAGQENDVVVVPLRLQPLHIGHLVGEDVALVAEDVVEPVQRLVEERGRAGDREDPVALDVVDVPQRAVEAALALLLPEGALGVVGQLVHHREPDRARELQQVGVDVAVLEEHAHVGGAGVVLVEQARAVGVLHPQRRVADGAVGGAGERLDHDLDAAGELHDLLRDGLDELVEAEGPQFRLQLVGRVFRQQDGGVLADALGEVLLVEVVAVQVRDVQVVGLPERVPVEPRVVGEGVPGREVGGVHPGVAQDRSCCGLDEHAGVASTGDSHGYPSGQEDDDASTLQVTAWTGPGRAGLWRGRLSAITGEVGGTHMAAEEQILSPDQRKPTSRKALYTALSVAIVINLAYLFGNHQGWVEDVFIAITVVVLLGVIVSDAWLRRTGLR
jgi:hypothetical protein